MKQITWLKPAIVGAAVGMVGLAIVGFTAGGWVTGSTAEKMAQTQATAAVVSALAPICAKQIEPQMTEFDSLKGDSGKQIAFIVKSGASVMPGSEKEVSGVSRACLTLLASVVTQTSAK